MERIFNENSGKMSARRKGKPQHRKKLETREYVWFYMAVVIDMSRSVYILGRSGEVVWSGLRPCVIAGISPFLYDHKKHVVRSRTADIN